MDRLGKTEFTARIKSKLADTNGTPDRTGTRIIVVDDSKMMLRLYQNKLSAMGYTPTVFSRPEDAIPEILAQKPDLIITDLNMPNISGLELTREIRKKYNRRDLPIVMITTQSDFVEDESGSLKVDDGMIKKTGINQVVYKPFTDEDLKQAMTTLIDA